MLGHSDFKYSGVFSLVKIGSFLQIEELDLFWFLKLNVRFCIHFILAGLHSGFWKYRGPKNGRFINEFQLRFSQTRPIPHITIILLVKVY